MVSSALSASFNLAPADPPSSTSTMPKLSEYKRKYDASVTHIVFVWGVFNDGNPSLSLAPNPPLSRSPLPAAVRASGSYHGQKRKFKMIFDGILITCFTVQSTADSMAHGGLHLLRPPSLSPSQTRCAKCCSHRRSRSSPLCSIFVQ